MDQSKALHQLTEAADLITMLESLTNPASLDSATQLPWGGLRITLRNVREMILGSHDTLAADLVARARARMETQASHSSSSANGTSAANADNQSESALTARSATVSPVRSTTIIENQGIKMQRKDLRAHLERFVER